MEKKAARILVIDDDPAIVASLALLLKQEGYASEGASSPEEALRRVEQAAPALVLQDMNFSRATSGAEGLALLRQLKSARPRLPVVLMTAWGSIELAVKGMQAGAADFVSKPWTRQQLLQTIATALGLAAAGEPQGRPSRAQLEASLDLHGLAGEDPRLLEILSVLGRVAPTDAAVLITGESGTGKELIAAALHRNSARRKGPFVKVNLGGISASLFESEMFGHLRGAFTDAKQDRKGRFALANGGTIFLDEVGDLDAASQVKLLRVLQDRTYEVLGSSESRTVDVRVVSATNRDLRAMVASGDFREDLLYRLNLIALELPPLRERLDDIAILARQFLAELGKTYGKPGLEVTAAAEDWLRDRAWPGNVRQLRQLLERTVLISGKTRLDALDFQQTFGLDSREPGPGAGALPEALPQVGSMTLDELEHAMILKSVKHHGGNLTKVAESLGLSRPALYRRLEKYGIRA